MTTKSRVKSGPRVLFLDIETTPILAHVWGLWDQRVALNQIERDWSIMSYSAKWLGDAPSKIIYQDVSGAASFFDDSALLKSLWKLLDQADVVVAQNGVKFDKKKIFARFAILGMQPPATFKMVDTMLIAKKVFGFTSNKLEYLSDKLNKKYKKQKHEKFSGFELWRECLAGNKAAWKAMRQYNIYDVLALEELYHKLLPWNEGMSYDAYHEDETPTCTCGSQEFIKRGFHYTQVAKYQRYRCVECGAWTRGRENLLSINKRKALRVSVPR
jgi:hypothetical protein